MNLNSQYLIIDEFFPSRTTDGKNCTTAEKNSAYSQETTVQEMNNFFYLGVRKEHCKGVKFKIFLYIFFRFSVKSLTTDLIMAVSLELII